MFFQWFLIQDPLSHEYKYTDFEKPLSHLDVCHTECKAVPTWVAPTARTYGLEAGNRGEYPHLDKSPLARNDDAPSSTMVVENIKSFVKLINSCQIHLPPEAATIDTPMALSLTA